MKSIGDADEHSYKNTEDGTAVGEKIEGKFNGAVFKIVVELNIVIIFNAKGNQEKKNNN